MLRSLIMLVCLQVIPLMASIAVPTLRLSQDVLDFGTCLVGQSVEMHVTLRNPSRSASAWVAKKGFENSNETRWNHFRRYD